MGKHAYLVIANRNFKQLCTLLSLLDDSRNDIYLMIDAKSREVDINQIKKSVVHSELTITTPIKIYWGDYSQIQAELILLKTSVIKHYSYYHLLSGLDLPLHNQDYIHSFFSKHTGKEFLTYTDRSIFIKNHIENRVKYYYLFSKLSERTLNFKYWPKVFHLLNHTELFIQKLFKINRWKNNKKNIMYGSNWFSIDDQLANYVVDNEQWIKDSFDHSLCGDELFIHTLVSNSKFDKQIFIKEGVKDKPSDRQGNMRYINWWDGGPYTWTEKDYESLIAIINRGYLFSRKFDATVDSKIIDKITELVRNE